MTPQRTWHQGYWSPHSDGMGGSYVYCCCTNGKHHPDHHIKLDKFNALEREVTALRSQIRDQDEASHTLHEYIKEMEQAHLVLRAQLEAATKLRASITDTVKLDSLRTFIEEWDSASPRA